MIEISFTTFIMVAVLCIFRRYGIKIKACRKNQPNKSKLALYYLLISC